MNVFINLIFAIQNEQVQQMSFLMAKSEVTNNTDILITINQILRGGPPSV